MISLARRSLLRRNILTRQASFRTKSSLRWRVSDCWGCRSPRYRGAPRTQAHLEGDEWVINGEKMWITNAPIAGHIIVTAVTDKDRGKRGISSIIVPRGTAGLSFGKHEAKMGLHGSLSTAVFLENVRVPQENLLGERGRGFVQFLQILDGGRITIGAMAIGLAQAAMDAAVRYAHEREAF